ncbi:DUF1490 family protein [Gordonia sp. L191]|uniref:DUF1490 family protein n=1 Tax=Gordonia sp. L191 TaxID=2982699 RepID=UPI0024C0049E|nr:DUF1490 family protein [Gordonia sp. L191]WHU48461.1 DUF1490 family protein [Gordonia sp. L191]
MALHGFLTKAGSTIATGLVGAVAYDVARKAIAKAPLRQGAVVVTSWGLVGTRKAEAIAEDARLRTADIVAEAKDRIGEETSPPGTAEPHDHDH